jgi:hypothetical protein
MILVDIRMALLINWFKVDLSPGSFILPTKNFPTWEDSTTARDSEALKAFRLYRGKTGADTISIVLLSGPEPPDGWEGRQYGPTTHRNVIGEIIKRGLEDHFEHAGLSTVRSSFGITATRPVTLMANDSIQLSTGIACQVHNPGTDSGVGVSVQWQVKTEFVKSLADDELRRMSESLPVLLRYNPRQWQPVEELRRFHNRYLGIVCRVLSNDTIEVLARDNKRYQVPADKLFIEAKPSTIKEYENRSRNSQGTGAVWRRIQELNHVLTSAGRRNTSVLQERLNSIRRFLSPQGNDLLVLDLPIYGGGRANLDLRPAVVQTGAG